MNLGAQRDIYQRQRIAWQNVRIGSAHDRLPNFNASGRDDVSLLAIEIRDQGNVCRAIRVILNLSDAAWYAFLIALEIDDTVKPLVTAASASHRDAAIIGTA